MERTYKLDRTDKKILVGLCVAGTIGLTILGLFIKTPSRYNSRNLERKVQKRNVIGNPDIPETFYNTAEGKAYLTIDGKPVDEYLRSR